MVEEWSDFFDQVAALTESGQRQYGIANLNYSEYFIDRLALCINTCTSLLGTITSSAVAGEATECTTSLTELIECLQRLHHRWVEYKSFLEGPYEHYHPLLTAQRAGGRGRPRFQVSKSQLEYLVSLSFKWTEIASILGISRMTLYRYDFCTGADRPKDIKR